ncbi:hypothetical protein FHG87_011548 [Trinorchestia longiramus]|nr:hypothetical protein FHG87_011548 [Trinorchestia longiramus]
MLTESMTKNVKCEEYWGLGRPRPTSDSKGSVRGWCKKVRVGQTDVREEGGEGRKSIATVKFLPVGGTPPENFEVTVPEHNHVVRLADAVLVAAGRQPSTRTAVGFLDSESLFREIKTSSELETLSSNLQVHVIELPEEKSGAYFVAVVNVGHPQLPEPLHRRPTKWPFALNLLRTLNYDQIYETILSRLQDVCPPAPEEDADGRPWWVWDQEQDKLEQLARENWGTARGRYPEVMKGKNPGWNWTRDGKHYYFRIHKVDEADNHLRNDGLPMPGWTQGLNHLQVEFHPLYARKAMASL